MFRQTLTGRRSGEHPPPPGRFHREQKVEGNVGHEAGPQGRIPHALAVVADDHGLGDRDQTTEDEQKTGPVQVREEVVGTSSKAKNKNMGNSGFSGGNPERREAA